VGSRQQEKGADNFSEGRGVRGVGVCLSVVMGILWKEVKQGHRHAFRFEGSAKHVVARFKVQRQKLTGEGEKGDQRCSWGGGGWKDIGSGYWGSTNP